MASLVTVFVFLYYLAFCWAEDPNKVFQWQFTASVSTQLPSCQDLSILVKPFNPNNATGSTGIPPYYMLSFAAHGLPKTDFIGTDPTSLKWTVNHPIGTSLMLSVVDSAGSAGGIPPQLYTVVTGQSTACVEPSAPSDFTVTSNVTDTLTTCQPWGIRIKGGVPPYNLTLVAVNSPIVTNVTLGPVDDAFTYIDRADPNRQLLAAVSDFTGRWAYGTPIVTTQGSSNVDCIGLVSSSGNATVLDNQDKAAAAALAAAASRKRSSIIAGVVVSILVVLALVSAWYFFLFRRRVLQGDAEKGQDLSVNPFSTPPPSATTSSPGQVLSITSFISSPPSSPKSTRHSLNAPSPQSQTDLSSPISRPSSGRTSRSKPSFVAFPRASTRTSAKAAEAAASPPSPHSPVSPSSPSAQAEGPSAEYVYQHRDGGRVRELPPPYMNPSRPATPES